MSDIIANLILIAKYAVAIAIVIAIVLFPFWVASVNGKSKPDMGYVRLGSWLFGWSGIGWLYALFFATKK